MKFIFDEIKPSVDVERTLVVLVNGALDVLDNVDDIGGAYKPPRPIPVGADVVIAAVGSVGTLD